MKNILALIAVVIFRVTTAYAQNSFDTLSVNNVHAGFNAAGDMFYNLNTNGNYINAPGNSISFSAANLWIGGYDNNGRLNVSAQTYRQSGTDFWPGPLDTIGLYADPAESQNFNYVWNLHCDTVSSFIAWTQSPSSFPTYTVPADIQSWPGNGDAQYGQAQFLAPFVDVDGDQYYNYAAGDYPSVRGTQSLFYIYNDSLLYNAHTETNSSQLGLQIDAMPYAYNYSWDEAIMNTIFVHYKIHNYSTFSYTGAAIGLWADFDFTGGINACASDSTLEAVFQYNADNAVAMYFLSDPMGGVISYENSFAVFGNPTTPLDYYEFLNQQWSPSNSLSYGGNGYNTGNNTRWMYTGDPSNNSGWLDGGGDHRTVAATDSFTIAAGSVKEFVIAFSFAYDTSAQYASYSKAAQYVTHIRQFYSGNNDYCSGQATTIEEFDMTKPDLYPNPAINSVIINGTTQNDTYVVINVQGQVVMTGQAFEGSTPIDISSLPNGVYMLSLTTSKEISTTRFVKAD